MPTQEHSLRTQIAVGWVLMLLILAIMLEFMIVQASFSNDDFKALRHDPGKEGLEWVVWVLAIYIAMPIYIFVSEPWKSRFFRWPPVAASGVILAYFIIHHTGHWVAGDRPTLSSHVLDVAHHVVSLWVLVSSARLAVMPGVAKVPAGSPVAA